MTQMVIHDLLLDNSTKTNLSTPCLTLTIRSSDVYFYQEWSRVRLPVFEDTNSSEFAEAIAICIGNTVKDRQGFSHKPLGFKFDIEQFETLPGPLDRLAALKEYLPRS
jgi:hypothetical protein